LSVRAGAAPRVSVAVPVRDGEAFLAEAIESVLAQSFEDWELVIVDDGSRDATRSIAQRFAEADPRVRLIVNGSPTGPAAAANAAWQAAHADYIARLDHDDVALPDRLARQVEFLDRHPSVAVVGGGAVMIDAAGRRFATFRSPTSPRAVRSALLGGCCLVHSSTTTRRTALAAVGGYRLDGAEDYDLWLRLVERYEIANLREPVVLYRWHAHQQTISALDRQVAGGLAAKAAARARRAGDRDPLDGVDELTPALLERLAVDQPRLDRAVARICLNSARVFAGLGEDELAAALLERAVAVVGERARSRFELGRELKSAERLAGAGHPLRAARLLAGCFRSDPRYTVSRLARWVRIRARFGVGSFRP
jgi:Glycosyl transferase family 2